MSQKESMEKYLGGKQASKLLNIHQRTLYQWEAKGLIETIRTPGNKRLYNVEKFLKEKEPEKIEVKKISLDEIDKMEGKLNISYVRVSSLKQQEELEKQKKIIMKSYPDHIMIEDIGSGINLMKKGIKKIIKLAIAGKLNEVVIAYKSSLARFDYELIEHLIEEYSKGKIIIVDKNEEETEEEIMKDIIEIMDVIVEKINKKKKYKRVKQEEILKK